MANILTDSEQYCYWRDEKLAAAATELSACLIEIKNPLVLSKVEKNKIQQSCQQNNFALFHIEARDDYENAIVNINTQFGLKDYDRHLFVKNQGLAYITQSNNKDQSEFIPYTNKGLGWHTDGYYNPIEQRIRAFSLFCVRPGASGGANQWIDSQMVYLLLRENNPDIAKALTHPQTMVIPEHRVNNEVRRPTSTGPVFFIDEVSGALSMRYTQRKTNIAFLDSIEIRRAVESLDKLLNGTSSYHFAHLMSAGQGLLCNNIVHKRSTFTDDADQPRLLLRGRYFNRIG